MSKNNKPGDQKTNAIVLGIIAGITVVIVAAIGMFSRGGNPESSAREGSSAPPAAADSMADHHGGGAPPPPAVPLDALVGKPLPDFTLADRDGKIYNKETLRGKTAVLFFNEGLMCYPACWQQIAGLAADPRLQRADAVMLSVVIDPPGEWQRAINKMPELGKANVLFDANSTVSRQLGMLTAPSSMHYGSFPGHTYLVIDKEGVIKHVYDDPRMALHNDQLVEELKKL
ncbi:MAG: redoxin domain-containing protein [Candidatus Magasanikbacteria bacterium]|nr:redoxin domain-containing protein [Candidatus Magasanikbacteria bacterium]